jgi:hypothetical protein
MSDAADLEDLVAFLVRTSRLERPQAARLVDEVLAALDETPEDFIRRRHRALQGDGLSNEAIFARIGTELARRRFRAPAYTPRQIRRIIYG